MAFKSGIIFIGLLLGSLALPTPESGDLSIFFQNADSQARIVGGTPAPAGAHPWMAALTQGLIFRSFFCGGSIITPRTVLTAAHCISAVFSFGSLSNSLRVTVGTNQWNSGGQTLSVTTNATHLHYVSQTIKNDIGMLFTSSAIQFNNNVQPIALSFDYVGGGVLSRAAGWGQTSATGPVSNQLLQADVATIGGAECVRDVAQAAADLNFVPPTLEPHIELCTFHAPGRGMCRGDSGSALVRLDQGTQIGVVSWGFPCALGAPDMFVRVSAFQSWINQQSFG